ncbi:cupredoxin domain-containing protein [Tistlia consotensis]|nr:cupredoxin domain-containing protein [Tistlia consotensis]
MLPGAFAAAVFVLPLVVAGPAAAEEAAQTIVIKDHKFEPATVEVPAGKRVKLVIDNRDGTPEEFESKDLRREKVIPGNSKGSVWVGPLPKGEYAFVGEFHEDTAKGRLIAK